MIPLCWMMMNLKIFLNGMDRQIMLKQTELMTYPKIVMKKKPFRSMEQIILIPLFMNKTLWLFLQLEISKILLLTHRDPNWSILMILRDILHNLRNTKKILMTIIRDLVHHLQGLHPQYILTTLRDPLRPVQGTPQHILMIIRDLVRHLRGLHPQYILTTLRDPLHQQ